MTKFRLKLLSVILFNALLFSCQKEEILPIAQPITDPETPPVNPPIVVDNAKYLALNAIFDINIVPTITLDFTVEEWNKLLTNFDIYEDNQEHVVSRVSINRSGILTQIDSIGVRLKGNTSRRRPEGEFEQPHNSIDASWNHAHFALSFEEFRGNQEYMNLEKLNLKWFKDDANYVRELYCYDLFERFGIWTAPQSSYCRLIINVKGDSKPAYFGIYQMVEPVDKKFLKARENLFDTSNGNLWKASRGASLRSARGDQMGVDISTLDGATSKTFTYSLKTNKTSVEAAKSQLTNFITNLNSKSGDALKEWLKSNMDVELLLKTYAVNVMVGMWDDYWSNTNNYYFYIDINNKFTFIPYDYDNTLGTSLMMRDSGTQNLLAWGDSDNSPLIAKVLSIPEYKNIYINYLYDLIDPSKHLFDYQSSTERIVNWQNMISPYVSNDTGEDMRILDNPAAWGNQPKYRLNSADNNFFKIKASSLPTKPN